jgi:predicted membrane-bound mannosyltransferase
VNSILAYETYFSRAGHDALHIHPWHYYLQMLLLSKYGDGPTWSEAFIVIFAAIGFVVAMRRDHRLAIDSNLARFIAFYTLIMTIIYSIIPYKTPWNLLGFLHGMILLAAIGVEAVIKFQMNKSARVFVNLLMIAGVAQLASQAYLANYRYFDDSTNPYVYAHTVSDVYKVVARVQEMASAHPDGRSMHIEVIFPGNDYWPLPWYLRAFSNVGWWDKVDEQTPAAPVIIASASVEREVIRKLYELPPPGQRSLYLPLFDLYTELRPKVEMRGYAKKELWDKFQAQQSPPIEESH